MLLTYILIYTRIPTEIRNKLLREQPRQYFLHFNLFCWLSILALFLTSTETRGVKLTHAAGFLPTYRGEQLMDITKIIKKYENLVRDMSLYVAHLLNEDVEDVMQDSFLHLVKKSEVFDEENTKTSTLLYSILHNFNGDKLRNAQRHRAIAAVHPDGVYFDNYAAESIDRIEYDLDLVTQYVRAAVKDSIHEDRGELAIKILTDARKGKTLVETSREVGCSESYINQVRNDFLKKEYFFA